MLGNPYTNPKEQLFGQMAHFAGSSLIPISLFEQFVKKCKSDNTDCDAIISHITSLTKDIYIYGTEFPVCPSSPISLRKSLSGLNGNLSKPMNELFLMFSNSKL